MAYERRAIDETPAQIFLQPVAAPSVLGLLGFAGATFLIGTYMAGWYGVPAVNAYLFPFAAVFGGLAQFLAGMWAFRARDTLASAMHGMWGAFFLGYGLLYLLVAVGAIGAPVGAVPALGFWWIVLAAISYTGAFAALGDNLGMFAWLLSAAVAATLIAIGELAGLGALSVAGGWVLLLSMLFAWYTGAALLYEMTYGRAILPIGYVGRQRAEHRLVPGIGEPGVIRGQ
ncbi:MAG: hypothetical protein IRZ14_05850 [Chloroflexi bacterium]|nr:hypothetical protein [Chloroflexota bacterium]